MEQQVWNQHYDKEVPYTLDYPDITLYEFFEKAVKESPSQTATLFFGAKITYGKLGRLVDRFAAALAGIGVRKGDRVALILPNIPAYPIAHFAVIKLGAILVPTNPLYVERELEYQLNNSGAETVIAFDKLHERISSVVSSTSIKRVIYVGVQEFLSFVGRLAYKLKNFSKVNIDTSSEVHFYSQLMKKNFPAVKYHRTNEDENAIFLYTGGTTGISKGAVLTHRNLVANVLQTRAWLVGFRDRSEKILAALPFFHSYGMTTSLHLAIQAQSTLVLLPRFDVVEVVKTIKKHRPTIFCGVPSMYGAINLFPGLEPKDVNSIRLCVSGGAALPSKVQKRFEALTGGRLVEGYGLSETSPVAIVNPVFGTRKNGTIGVPIPDTLVRIVDNVNRNVLPLNEVGELAIKGPQVMKKYWNMTKETLEVLEDGWLYTGDLAFQDKEGFVTIVDRKKDIIISAGMNIYPREIEEVLMSHTSVIEVAVVGVPSRVREEVVKAYIVAEPQSGLTKTDIIDFCVGKLAKYKMPKRIQFCSELPKSGVGKILKRVLLEEEKKTFSDLRGK